MRGKTVEITQLKMNQDVLIVPNDASYRTSLRKPTRSRKDKKAAFDLHTSSVNKGIRSKFIFKLTYLNNNVPRNCKFLAAKTTVSDFKSLVRDGWFPNEVCPGSLKMKDWFGRTVQPTGIDESDSDMNLENHPFGAIFREVVVTEGHAERQMLHVPLCFLEQASDGMFYTLPSGSLKLLMGKFAAIAYSKM